MRLGSSNWSRYVIDSRLIASLTFSRNPKLSQFAGVFHGLAMTEGVWEIIFEFIWCGGYLTSRIYLKPKCNHLFPKHSHPRLVSLRFTFEYISAICLTW